MLGITMPHVEADPPYQPATSTLTRKGQLTIPAPIRRLLGVGPQDRVAFLVRDGEIHLAPATSAVARTAGVLGSNQPALSPEEEEAAAEAAIAEEAAAP